MSRPVATFTANCKVKRIKWKKCKLIHDFLALICCGKMDNIFFKVAFGFVNKVDQRRTLLDVTSRTGR